MVGGSATVASPASISCHSQKRSSTNATGSWAALSDAVTESRWQMNAVRRVEEMRRRWGEEPLDHIYSGRARLPEEAEHMTKVALAHSEELHDLVVGMIPYRIVENTNSYRNRHFFIFDEYKPV